MCGHQEVTHLPKVTYSSSSLSEKVKSFRPIFVELRNQAAYSAVYCSSVHRGANVFHPNSSLVTGSSSERADSEFEGDSEEFVSVIGMNSHQNLISFILAIRLRYVAIL